MPGGVTHFQKDRLKEKDENGHILSLWCKQGTADAALCIFCNKYVKQDNQGLPQLIQRERKRRRKGLVKDVASGNQTAIRKNLDNGNVTCESAKDAITKVELIWDMKSVSSHFSYSASDNIKLVLNAMFPEKIPANFTMSSSKLSYLTSDGTGPYFNSLMVKDITKLKTPYSIHFDETSNNQGHKQLDIKIRHWSNNQNKIVIHYLRTYFMGHATGQQLADKLVSSLQENNISLKQLQVLESDGPNVNKTVWNKVNEVVLALPERSKGLVEFTCLL